MQVRGAYRNYHRTYADIVDRLAEDGKTLTKSETRNTEFYLTRGKSGKMLTPREDKEANKHFKVIPPIIL